FFSSRRRHTRSKRDWSSDVCSSDLISGSPSLIEVTGGLVASTDLARDRALHAAAIEREGAARVEAAAGWDCQRARDFAAGNDPRSEERRVGKEGRHRWWTGR